MDRIDDEGRASGLPLGEDQGSGFAKKRGETAPCERPVRPSAVPCPGRVGVDRVVVVVPGAWWLGKSSIPPCCEWAEQGIARARFGRSRSWGCGGRILGVISRGPAEKKKGRDALRARTAYDSDETLKVCIESSESLGEGLGSSRLLSHGRARRGLSYKKPGACRPLHGRGASMMMASNLASPGVHVLARRPSPPPPLCPPGPGNSPWMPGSVGVATCRAGRTQQGHRIVRPVTSPTTRPMPAAAADGAVAGRKYCMIRLEKSVPCLTADAVPSKRTGYMGREPQQGGGHGETAVSWTRAGLMVTEETRKGTTEVRLVSQLVTTHKKESAGDFLEHGGRLVANSIHISGFSRLPSLRPTDRLGRAGQYGTRVSLATHLNLILTAGPLPLYF